MPRAPLILLALVTATAAAPLAAPLGAQQDRVPRRPRLEAGADTNDAMAYYRHGSDRIQKRPGEAADAFYWAARLAPGWADPLYGRYAALRLNMSRQRQLEYLRGNRRLMQSAEVQRMDSLMYRAYLLNPFVRRPFDRLMIEQLVPAEDWFFFRQALDEAARRDPAMAAWFASSDGRFRDAIRYYGQAIERHRDAYGLRGERARAYFVLAMHDSALADLTTLVEQMRQREERQLVYLYDSKALFEHSIGLIWLMRGQPDSARAAFGRALTEDLAFHAAHAAMGHAALELGDTATAATEYELAVQISPEDAALRHDYGRILIAQGKAAEALTQLERAVELEPYYAEPYFLMARVQDHYGFAEDAARNYRAFAERAPARDHERLAFATARHAELAAQVAADASAAPQGQP